MAQASEGKQKSGKTASRPGEVFELKSASLSVLALVLKTTDLQQLADELSQRLGDTPEVFDQDPLLIDCSQLPQQAADADDSPQLGLLGEPATLDLPRLLKLLRQHRLQPVAITGAGAELLAAAKEQGLVEAADLPPMRDIAAPAVREVEVVREVVVERQVSVPAEPARTVVVDKPLRSGQQVYAKGADLVVLALVNHGAEVIADGSIHVYAPLRGKAIAGARGNADARIFAASLEAELIAIAGIYRTTENPLPPNVLGKPAQVRLEGEKLVMEPLQY
jgi:septum site-determining protein MinC